jgi:hypothetical protein
MRWYRGMKSGPARLPTRVRRPDRVPHAGQDPITRSRAAPASADADFSPSAATRYRRSMSPGLRTHWIALAMQFPTAFANASWLIGFARRSISAAVPGSTA